MGDTFYIPVVAANGPYVIGYTLCFGLMGALVIQASTYFTKFTDDRKAIKALVVVILLLETAMTALAFYNFWEASAVGMGFATSENNGLLAPFAGLVTTLTQGFYCWRISTLCNSLLIPLPIMTISILQLASIVRLGVANGLYPAIPTVSNILPESGYVVSYSKLSPWLVIWLVSSVMCDSAITTSMTLSLRPVKSQFGTNKTTLVKLTRLSIETGLVTTAAALIELILGVVYQHYMYHIAVFYVSSKLYANCLLATLNFRLVLRDQSNPSMSAIVWNNAKCAQERPHVAHILARVDTEIEVVIDFNETSHSKISSTDEDRTSQMFGFPKHDV